MVRGTVPDKLVSLCPYRMLSGAGAIELLGALQQH